MGQMCSAEEQEDRYVGQPREKGKYDGDVD